MIQRVFNLLKLVQIFRERGNWPLIQRSRKQLLYFLLCRNGLIDKPLWAVLPYWYKLLKGLDALVWRLETFGFLFPSNLNNDEKQALNRYL